VLAGGLFEEALEVAVLGLEGGDVLGVLAARHQVLGLLELAFEGGRALLLLLQLWTRPNSSPQ
jgi:hypothetical protein